MKMDPNDFNILVDLYKSGKIKEVEKGAKSLIKRFPKEIMLHNLLGAVYLEMKKLDLAEKFFNKAIEIMPNYAEGHNNLGNVYRLKQKPKQALLSFNEALKLNPDFADAHNNIGIVYKENDNFERARFHYKKSIELKPGSPDPYNNIGNLFKDSGMLDEAIKNFEVAIQLNQNFFEAYNNLALTYQKKKLFEKAEKLFLKAIKILPDFEEAKYNLGYLYLTCENFKEGWKWHEYRKAKSLLKKRHKLNYDKEWNGKKFEGKLLVIGEQGLGDQVMYASIFNDLIKKQKNISVIVEDRLVTIFERSFNEMNFISDKNDLSKLEYDKFVFLGSLGKMFRKFSKDFKKSNCSFLIPKKSNLKEMKKYLKNSQNKKIGISWKTSSVNNRKQRSIPLELFEPVLKIKNFDFIDLQYGDTLNERKFLKNKLGVEIFHINELDYKNDIENLAALTSHCDLVITIPNFTTQLAGALGKNVFVLLPLSADWRWFLNDKKSLWYPNTSIFRQEKFGEWKSVINKLYKTLRG